MPVPEQIQKMIDSARRGGASSNALMLSMKYGIMDVTPAFIVETAEKAEIDIIGYDVNQLTEGYKVELEHFTIGDRPRINVVASISDPLRIAVAHLDELPDYYTRLKRMERG